MLRIFIVGFILYILTAFTPDNKLNSEIKSLKKELQQLNGSIRSEAKEITAPLPLLSSHKFQRKITPFFSE
jgi:hypothetical protein